MQIYKVGGAVRDRLLGRPVTEVDWVVVGSSAEEMQAKGFKPVGADFPVFLHPATGEEYALARTERKSGRGYGGFTFYASPDVTLEEDLTRRDLTINAMAEDEHGHVIDPYGGQADLAARQLRHVSPAFAEDPLRVLRVARFAARYAELGFVVAPETQALMRQLTESGELHALTPERSWKEISRALMEARPDVFIQVLHDCGALKELFPEVAALFAKPDAVALPGTSTGRRILRTLRECAVHQQPITVRWACLLQHLAQGDGAEVQRGSARTRSIEAVNSRFKVPRDCQELAVLTGAFHGQAQHCLQLTAQALYDMLQHFDIFRRPDRFDLFIAACEMDATSHSDERSPDYPLGRYLRGAADAARSVQAKPLIAQGYKGAELGEALKRERLAAVQSYQHEYRETEARLEADE